MMRNESDQGRHALAEVTGKGLAVETVLLRHLTQSPKHTSQSYDKHPFKAEIASRRISFWACYQPQSLVSTLQSGCSAYERGFPSSSSCISASHSGIKKTCTNIQSSSNVSPLHFVLFVGATYYLNRPCIYCSLLLTILVFCLYDFHTNWFEAQTDYSASQTSEGHEGSILQKAAMESASIAASILNSTAASAVQGAVEAAKQKMNVQVPAHINGADWLKELLGKKEWRIPCIDVAVRF